MYIARHIEKTIEKSFAAFPAVLITGPRQVGKSTLLLNRFKNIPNVTLDNPLQLLSLRQDPVEFFKLHGSPLIIDEVQRAPECFSVLKYMIDSDRRAGMYILTGSQKICTHERCKRKPCGANRHYRYARTFRQEIYEDPFDRPFCHHRYLLTPPEMAPSIKI